MSKHIPRNGVAELIIGTQSLILAFVGLAGFMAVNPVNRGFQALRDKDSMVAIVTDKGLTTDKVEVDMSSVERIIKNYESVCMTAMCIGFIVFIFTILRHLSKINEGNNPLGRLVNRLRNNPKPKRASRR
jgi:hypothetical protein